MKKFLLLLAASAASTFSAAILPAAAGNVCESEMTRAAKQHGVPLGMLYAVGLTESGHKDSLQPYAMNIGGRAYFASGVDDALREFNAARKQGIKLIDIGCMQINHYFHGEEFASVAAMFNPHDNVDYAARFLKSLRAREGSWTLAVARYHAGPDNNPAQKRYVCKVIGNMVATGFGTWTTEARNFCA
jgi:soluble lytic murein transglycosylase-like protein